MIKRNTIFYYYLLYNGKDVYFPPVIYICILNEKIYVTPEGILQNKMHFGHFISIDEC